MILQALLFVALAALALLSRRVRAFAVALLCSVAATAGAEWAQFNLTPPAEDPLLFYQIPSYTDAFVFSAIAVSMIGVRLTWWGVLVCALSIVTVVYDTWFWQAYYLGVAGDPYYVPVLQGLFLISVAVLALAGGKDVFERIGSLLASLRDVLVRAPRIGWARSMRRKAVLEERA